MPLRMASASFGPMPLTLLTREEKEVAFLGGWQSRKGVWASSRIWEVGEDFSFRAGRRKSFVVGGERDVEVVADAARLEDKAGGQDFNDGAAKKGNHLDQL